MFCSNCGKELADNAKFCDGCGSQINVGAQSVLQNSASNNVQGDDKSSSKINHKGKFICGIVLVSLAMIIVIDALFFKDSLIMFDDGVLNTSEIISLIICIGGFGGIGSWLIYKSRK